MRDKKEFYEIIESLDQQPVSEFSQLAGDFDFTRFVLKIDDVQRSRLKDHIPFIVRVPAVISEFPEALIGSPLRCTAVEDYLARRLADEFDAIADFNQDGTAVRRLEIAEPVDVILPRSTVVVTEEYIEARVSIRLPRTPARIDADVLREIFFEDLPAVVNEALLYYNLDERELTEFVAHMEDTDAVRQLLPTQNLIAFIPEGTPLDDAGRYPHEAPAALQCDAGVATELTTPNDVSFKGVGLSTGITVILGDEYSGRIALMRALANGIYNRPSLSSLPSAVTVPDAVYVAAEPGRSVQQVDASVFIRGEALDAGIINTEWASAYESQAAAVIENLEVGAHVMLFDESDSASSFICGDSRAAALMNRNRTLPLSACARKIVDELGVSIVLAGSAAMGDYLSIADTVLTIEDGVLRDVTAQAKQAAGASMEVDVDVRQLHELIEKSRSIIASSIDPSLGIDDAVIQPLDVSLLEFGRSIIDLSAVPQLVDMHQTNTIGLILYYAKTRYMSEGRSIREVLDLIDRDLSTEGLECLTGVLRGDLARPRRYEIAAAINRLDALRIANRVD